MTSRGSTRLTKSTTDSTSSILGESLKKLEGLKKLESLGDFDFLIFGRT